jgi:hypothetical protein
MDSGIIIVFRPSGGQTMSDGKALLNQLRDAKIARASVYLNVKRIDELYRQRVTRISNVIASEELGPEFSAGLAGIFNIKVSGTQGLSTEYDIAPADKALLIEIVERRDGGLHAVQDNVPMGALVWFLDESQIANGNEEATEETTVLPAEVASVVQKRRIAEAKGSKMGTIVWTSKDRKYLAAIAYLESVVDVGHIYSYPKGRQRAL